MAWHFDTFLSLWVCSCVCTLQAWQRATFLQLQKIGTIPMTLHSCHKNFRLQHSVLQKFATLGYTKIRKWYLKYEFLPLCFNSLWQPTNLLSIPAETILNVVFNQFVYEEVYGSNKVAWSLRFIFHLLSFYPFTFVLTKRRVDDIGRWCWFYIF